MDGVERAADHLALSGYPPGWDVLNRLITAMEKKRIESAARPIEIEGETGADSWVIT